MKYRYLILPTEELVDKVNSELSEFRNKLTNTGVQLGDSITARVIIELGIYALNKVSDKHLASVGIIYTTHSALLDELDTFVVENDDFSDLTSQEVKLLLKLLFKLGLSVCGDITEVFDRINHDLDVLDVDLVVERWLNKDVMVNLRQR